MANLKFEATGIHVGYGQQAMRDAVLGNLFAPKYYRKTHVSVLLRRLRARWYRRLSQLNSAGWKPIQERKTWQYARNCPPFSITTDDTSVRCGYRFCPFCWARAVPSDLYNKVLGVWEKPTPRRFALFTLQRSWSRDVLMSEIVELLKDDTFRNHNLQYAPGWSSAFISHTLTPFSDHILLKRKTLVVIPEKARLELPTTESELQGLSVWEPETPTRKSLVPVVVAASRYPSQLLNCPATDLIDYLDATARLRMRVYLGGFRQSRIKDD